MLMGLFTRDSGPTIRYVLIVFNFFHSRERIKKYPDSPPHSPDACGQKLYPERKGLRTKAVSGKKRFANLYISGYLWTGLPLKTALLID